MASAPEEFCDDDKTEQEHPQPPDFDPIWSERERQELTRIATQQSALDAKMARGETQQSQNDLSPDSPYLDPHSKSFDLYKWMRFQLRKFDEGIKPRRTGVVFKNLTVHGSGAEIQLQQTVGSLLVAPFRMRSIAGSKKTHKTILRNFDGCVQRGEMLMVLGRPGAGCSTFLKSIAADVYGLTIDKDSVIHYDGIPQKLMKREFKGEILYNQEVEKRE